MKESKANSIAQILSPVDLVCLSAPYIAKENWLRAKLLNIPSTEWFFKHVRETSFQASLRNCINCVHCDDHFFIFRNVIATTLFPSPWTIGNFRASSFVTVFKALPTIQLLVTRLEVYIQPNRARMSSLQRNDKAKRAMSANWVAVLSVIIVKNIIPELNAGCFYLIFELKTCMATKNCSQPKFTFKTKQKTTTTTTTTTTWMFFSYIYYNWLFHALGNFPLHASKYWAKRNDQIAWCPSCCTKAMRQLATEDTYFVALFIKANHFLSDNSHGVVVIVTECEKSDSYTCTRDHQGNSYDCYGKGGFHSDIKMSLNVG